MADRVKFLLQKQISLKIQITVLSNALDKGKVNNVMLKLRLTRLTELYHNFEEYNDELSILDLDDEHLTEFTNIQERFYDLAARIEDMISESSTSSAGSG